MDISFEMEFQRRAAVAVALELGYQHQLIIHRRRQLQRKRRARRWWVRSWFRRLEYGHYNRLMRELRVEDENAFANYVRMPAHLFDELLNRISPIIQRRDTHLRPIRGQSRASRIPEWVKNIYECLRIDHDSVMMAKNALRIFYELTTIFWNREFVAKTLNSSKLLPRIPDWSELTTNIYETGRNFTNW